MSAYEDRQEIASKAEWEGGIDSFLLDYGFTVNDVPEGDAELRRVTVGLLHAIEEYEHWRNKFTDLLPESEEW